MSRPSLSEIRMMLCEQAGNASPDLTLVPTSLLIEELNRRLADAGHDDGTDERCPSLVPSPGEGGGETSRLRLKVLDGLCRSALTYLAIRLDRSPVCQARLKRIALQEAQLTSTAGTAVQDLNTLKKCE